MDATLAAWKDTPFDRWESTHSQVTLSCHLTVVETALLETICVQNMTKTTFLLPTSDRVLPKFNIRQNIFENSIFMVQILGFH